MIISLILGIFFGTIAGLVPGIHTNNIALLLTFTSLTGNTALVFVLSMVTTQSFVDFIPTVFIGATDDSFEGILPGHKMFNLGKAHEAITLTVFGGIIATIVSIICFPFFIEFIKFFPTKFELFIPTILIVSLIVLVMTETTTKKKFVALIVIIVSATHGLMFSDQIFPLISGYFGLPTLINSTIKKTKTKKQELEFKINKHKTIDAITGVIGGAIVAFVPGIGNNLAAALIRLFRQKIQTKNYLVLLGSINTTNFIFSVPVLIVLSKTRNGAMVFLKDHLLISEHTLLFSCSIILISAGVAAIITIIISKNLAKNINNKKIISMLDNKVFEKIIILLIIALVLVFNGLTGIIALIFSTALGIIAINTKTKRSNCLAFLIIPVLFFYLNNII